MVFGNKPGKKAKSLKISDRRKLSLLNAARIMATMHKTISPLQLVSGNNKRILHGIAMARDAIRATSDSKVRCCILDSFLKYGCDLVPASNVSKGCRLACFRTTT